MRIEPTLSALQAAQTRVSVSAHNIANLNTEGYQAQKAVQTSGLDGPKVEVTQGNEPTDLLSEIVDQKVAAYDYKANAIALKMQDEMLGQIIDIKA